MYIDNLSNSNSWVLYSIWAVMVLVVIMAIVGLVSSAKYLFKSLNKSDNVVPGSQSDKSLIKQSKFWYTLLLLGVSVYIINFAFKILGV